MPLCSEYKASGLCKARKVGKWSQDVTTSCLLSDQNRGSTLDHYMRSMLSKGHRGFNFCRYCKWKVAGIDEEPYEEFLSHHFDNLDSIFL